MLFVTTGGSPPGPTTAPELAPTAGPEVPIPAVGASIAVGKTPTFVTVSPNGRYAYIANGTAGLITVVDTAADYVTTTIPITVRLNSWPSRQTAAGFTSASTMISRRSMCLM